MTDKNVADGRDEASELADLIDKLMGEGSGHINIRSGDNGGSVTVDTVNSTECSGNKGACCQPTELDEDED